MNTVFPVVKETIVSNLAPLQIQERMRGLALPRIIIHHLADTSFSFTYAANPKNPFLPHVKGVLEPTPTGGCLISITYQLFKITKVYLVFWVLFGLVVAWVNLERNQSYEISLLTLGGCVLAISLAYTNFYRQVKLSRKALRKLLG